MPQILVIRHGESLANAGLQTADPASIALTEHGQQQAQRVAEWFSEPPTLIVTSRYLRTQQTAAPTLQRFPFVPHQVWEIHEFTYLSPLKADRTTPLQRQTFVQEYWNCRAPDYCDGEGAESFAQFVQRAETLLQMLHELPQEQSIALFSHGQFINMLLWRSRYPQIPLSHAAMRDWRQWNTDHSIPNAAILGFEQPQALSNLKPTVLFSA